jgi:hypothetical protein
VDCVCCLIVSWFSSFAGLEENGIRETETPKYKRVPHLKGLKTMTNSEYWTQKSSIFEGNALA